MNYDRLKNIHQKHSKYILPIKPGMFLEIHENVWEWDTKRIWKFKWLVIKVKKPNHPDGTFTIRGEVARMTIEKIYPLSFPNFEKVILLDDYKIRRSKLYYIRDKVGKDARFKSEIDASMRWVDLLEWLQPKKEEKVDVEVNTEAVETPVEKQEMTETSAETLADTQEVVEETAVESVAENVEQAVEEESTTNNSENVDDANVENENKEAESSWDEESEK